MGSTIVSPLRRGSGHEVLAMVACGVGGIAGPAVPVQRRGDRQIDLGVRRHRRHLGLGLVGRPHVVGVEEGDQLAGARGDAGVA